MRFTLLLAFLCLTLSLSAQRIGELRFAVPHQVMPAEVLPAEFTTFSTRVSDRYRVASRAGYTKLGLKNRLKLRNFRSLAVGGHLLVSYSVDAFRVADMKSRSKTTENKKKDGTVVKNTTYWMEGTYTFPIVMEVLDPDGGIVYEAIVGAEDAVLRYPEKSKTHASSSALSKDWYANRTKFYAALKKKQLNSAFNTLNANLRAQIDYREKKEYFYFEYPKGKKAENADLWLEHATAAKEILDTIDSNLPLPKTHLMSAMEPHLTFWKEQAAAYPASSKKTQRYHHAATYNLATAQMLLEAPALAVDLSKQLIADVKWNKNRSRILSRNAEALKTDLAGYPDGTRHFALRDVSRAKGPGNPTYGIPEPEKPVYDTLGAYYITDGARKSGRVIIRENVNVSFKGRNNFRFINDEEEEIAIDVNKVDGFGFGGIDFVVETWNDNGSSLKGRRNFMRVMLDGPRMQYLEYYPSHQNGSEIEVEFLKPKDDDMISLSVTNARWLNWKKAFAKVFADCPGLSQKVANGEFRRNVSDIADAVREYNEGNCEVAKESDAGDGK